MRCLIACSNQCCDDLIEEYLAVEIPASSIGPSFLCGVQPNKVLACVNHAALESVMLERPNLLRRNILCFGNESDSVHSENSNSSILMHCPVCSKGFENVPLEKTQQHVSECLNKRRGTVVGTRYVGMGHA